MDFLDIINYLGTFAFAISGIRIAAAKHFDWFGALVVGFVTAVGGGTIRDLLLDAKPFWMQEISYLVVTTISLFFVIIFRRNLVKLNNPFFIFDAIGLGLFTVVGIEKTLIHEYPMWVAIIMGTISGVAGGIIRDTLTNQVPLIFRKEIYAFACILGGFVYYLCSLFDVNVDIIGGICATTVTLARVLAVKYQISLPVVKGEEIKDSSEN